MSSSSELNTYLVTDSRYSNIKSQISIAVKDGPASVICQKYNPNSNSSSSTLWNVNVPSENTLIDRNLKIEGTLQCYYETTVLAADDAFSFYVAPAVFPLNQAIQSASFSINNAKVTVQSADILNVLTKQFDKKILSKHCQMTPNYVDKYYGSVSDAVPETHSTDDLSISIPKPSPYMNGVGGAEKDTDTSGRMDFAHTVTVTFNNVAVARDEFGKYNIGTGTAGTLRVQCSIKVPESIFGLPTVEIKENEANYLSINSLELNLMWNDMRNCFYISAPKVWACRAGTPTDSLVVDATTYLKLRQMSLHSSQYAKLSSRNI
jgi:hypothetical protein